MLAYFVPGNRAVRRRRHQRSVFLWAAAASLGLHLGLSFPLRSVIERFLGSVSTAAAPPVHVVQLTPEQWAQNLKVARSSRKSPLASSSKADNRASAPSQAAPQPSPEASPSATPTPTPSPSPERPVGQLVEVPPTADDSPNPSAKRSSLYNTHVEKETVARMEDRDPSLKRVTNKLQREKDAQAAMAEQKQKGDDLEESREVQDRRERLQLKIPDILKRDALRLKPGAEHGAEVSNRSGSEGLKGNSDRLEIKGSGEEEKAEDAGGKKGASDGVDRPVPTLTALMPNLGTLSRISGSPSVDHVEGLAEGEGTFLNTKEFKYATFFYRVRDSVYDHWAGALAQEYRRRDPTGNIYGNKDRSTLLRVELSRSGELDDVKVEQSSGVDFLDSVAVDAFRKAQPFPNPPGAIADDDGHIRFNFTFVVTMSGQAGFNLFRPY